MRAEIIFNNEAINKNFSIGWGISCRVNKHILFDTGEKPEYLFHNMEVRDINISDIEAVVISHDHWDHTGGLWELLKKRKGLKVYACPRFSQEFKDKVRALRGELIESEKFTEITKDIFVTGETPGFYKGEYMPEEGLIAKTNNGITLITGCAHPGIVKMAEEARKEFAEEQFYLVFGGFHLMDKDKRVIEVVAEKLKELKVKKVGPTHCSGKDAEHIFKQKYGQDFISIKAGQTVNI